VLLNFPKKGFLIRFKEAFISQSYQLAKK
jgi:hypothetical protein